MPESGWRLDHEAMTFRSKMLVTFTLAVAAGVGLLAWGVMRLSRQQFEQSERQQSDAAVAQFQRELAQRTDEVTFAVQGLADAEGTLRMAISLSQPQSDPSVYANDAHALAASHHLDFLELVGNDGVLISSAQWPGHVGNQNDWVTSETNWNQQGAFLSRVELQDEVQLGLLAVRVLNVGGKNLYIIGGRHMDAGFLQALPLRPGMRALLYSNLESAFVPAALTGASGAVDQPERFAPFIAALQSQPHPSNTTIQWTANPAGAEDFAAVPLTGRDGVLLGALLVGSSQRDLVGTLAQIRNLALAVGGGALLLEFLLAWWLSAEITVPLARLTAGAREVAAGNWTARVRARGRDEVGILAKEFNTMMRQLAERRELLMQTERVAAWREMAQRMSSEMNEPLLHLHATVERLVRTHEQDPEHFEEILHDSLKALRSEASNVKSAVSQFSDFARTPAPHLRPVSVNDTVRDVVKAFEPQFSSIGRPPVTPDLQLNESLPPAQADPDLLSLGLLNLMAHSVAAMPAGGTLTVRTALKDGAVTIEVSDTGATLMPGESGRGAKQPYATKLHGTGLGLATVQSVICDQGGRISVEWTPGAGSTFRIELPVVAGLAVPVRPQLEPLVPVPTQPVLAQSVLAPPAVPLAVAPQPGLPAAAPIQSAQIPVSQEPEPAPIPPSPAPEPARPEYSLEVETDQAIAAEPTPPAAASEPTEPVAAKTETPVVEELVEARKSDWRPFKSMFS